MVGAERPVGRRRAIHGLSRARAGGEDLTDLAGVLNGGDHAQAPTTARASEDIDSHDHIR